MKLHFADRTEGMRASIIREILKISSKDGVISFAGGLPSPTTFPLKDFDRAMETALHQDGTKALQYTVTEGHLGLKSYLCAWLNKQGIPCEPDEMLLTHGSQQALDLLAKIFVNPGDSVLVEDPTYLGAIQSFNAYQTKYLTVPIDEEGMHPDTVRQRLNRHAVRFAYVVPTFQNPSGVTMSLARRKAFLSIMRQKGIPVIEDDPYGLLRFRGSPVPSLYALAKGRGVIYLSTFSKLLSPGIRLGFVVADKSIIKQLVYAKQATDLQNNTLIQYAVYHYCQQGSLEKHLPAIRADYEHRAGVMMQAIHQHMPTEVSWNEPQGGMFVWCILPKGLNAKRVFQKAIKKKVAFVDGSVFYANGGGENTMRLNFTSASDADLRTGIKRLADVIQTFL